MKKDPNERCAQHIISTRLPGADPGSFNKTAIEFTSSYSVGNRANEVVKINPNRCKKT